MTTQIHVSDFLGKYPTDVNPDFNEILFKKNEFYSLREQPEEPASGELYNHQKVISRFLSPYTLQDSLLLMWEMGVGKTCAAIGAAENLKKHYKGVLVISRGPGIEKNFLSDMIRNCTKGVYEPTDKGVSYTRKERYDATVANIKKFYTFETYHFFDSLFKMTDAEYQRKVDQYSRCIIIIDEIHNIRVNKKAKKYRMAHKFLHDVVNTKKIIMSGTPMKDDPDEIAAVLNLLLPLENQMPMEEEFKEKFLVKRENNVYYIKDQRAKNELKEYMKAIVSYLKASPSDVRKNFMGENIGSLKLFKVVPKMMSKFQSEVYAKAYNLDVRKQEQSQPVSEKERQSFFKNSRQATLMVFPNGSYGSTANETYFSSKSKNLLNDLRNLNLTSSLIQNIKQCSAIYGSICEHLINPSNRRRLHFVYDSFVEGSGAIVLAKLLNFLGYTQLSGKESKAGLEAKPRFALITSQTSDASTTKHIIEDIFNSKENMYGDLLQVIIGSDVIMEGYNLKNVLDISIATPHWNYSETAQAIARGFRLNSHRDLVQAGITPDVNIYQYVAMPQPNDDVPSIDLHLYEISESKDISTKQIERLVRESAFDCALFFQRNKRTTDNSRECEYQDCEYDCDGVPKRLIMEPDSFPLDFSTFNLYYLQEIIPEIIRHITDFFSYTFSVPVQDLLNMMRKYSYSPFQVFSAIRKIIMENIPIQNPNGFLSYLREQNDFLFLVDSLSVGSDFQALTYTQFPIALDGESFDESLEDMYVPEMIKKLSQSTTQDEFNTFMNLLPVQVQDMFFEQERDPMYNEVDDVDERTKMIRSFNQNFFESRREKQAQVEAIPVETLERVNALPFNIYGLINKDGKFLLKRKATEEMKKPRGFACSSYKIPDLIKIINDFKVPFGNEVYIGTTKAKERINLRDISEDDLDEIITSDRPTEKIIQNLNLTDFEDKKRVVYFFNAKNVKERCEPLKEWFRSQGALFRAES